MFNRWVWFNSDGRTRDPCKKIQETFHGRVETAKTDDSTHGWQSVPTDSQSEVRRGQSTTKRGDIAAGGLGSIRLDKNSV